MAQLPGDAASLWTCRVRLAGGAKSIAGAAESSQLLSRRSGLSLHSPLCQSAAAQAPFKTVDISLSSTSGTSALNTSQLLVLTPGASPCLDLQARCGESVESGQACRTSASSRAGSQLKCCLLRWRGASLSLSRQALEPRQFRGRECLLHRLQGCRQLSKNMRSVRQAVQTIGLEVGTCLSERHGASRTCWAVRQTS